MVYTNYMMLAAPRSTSTSRTGRHYVTMSASRVLYGWGSICPASSGHFVSDMIMTSVLKSRTYMYASTSLFNMMRWSNDS